MTLGKFWLCTFIVLVLWRMKCWAICPEDRALSQYDSFRGMTFLKRPHIFDTGEDLLFTFRFKVLQGQSFLLGDRALSQYDSFSAMMVLKRLFINDSGEDYALHIHCSGLWKTELWIVLLTDRALSHSSEIQDFWDNMIGLVGKLSWKGCVLVTLGKPLLLIRSPGRKGISYNTDLYRLRMYVIAYTCLIFLTIVSTFLYRSWYVLVHA